MLHSFIISWCGYSYLAEISPSSVNVVPLMKSGAIALRECLRWFENYCTVYLFPSGSFPTVFLLFPSSRVYLELHVGNGRVISRQRVSIGLDLQVNIHISIGLDLQVNIHISICLELQVNIYIQVFCWRNGSDVWAGMRCGNVGVPVAQIWMIDFNAAMLSFC